MPIDYEPEKSTYPISPENAVEMNRLMVQDRLLTNAMGGILAEQAQATIDELHDVLDIACGPGGWVLDVAFEHPEINVIGIDISKTMIQYARTQASVQNLENAHFETMNILQPLVFPDHSFDLVNARYLQPFMPVTMWPPFIAECARITRPGGIIRLTEAENPGVSTSPAFQKLNDIALQALKVAEFSFSLTGYSLGLIPMQRRFLRDAGYQHIQTRASVLDFSVGTDAYPSYVRNLTIAYELAEPFFLKMGVTTPEELQQLRTQMADETARDDFCGINLYVTTWGRTPLA